MEGDVRNDYLMDMGVSFGGDKNILEPDKSNDCIVL